MILSKSKYMRYCQCPKILWMDNYKSELAEKRINKQSLYNPAKLIDNFSKTLFNSVSCIQTFSDSERFDMERMAEKTRTLLMTGTNSLYKPTFKYEENYFILDLVKKVKNGYNIYLVKPSKNLRQIFLIEMAYLAYILKKLEFPVYRYCIITINSDYEKHGEINAKKYFKINYVGKKIKQFENHIEDNLLSYAKMIENTEEPLITFGTQCGLSSTHSCPYISHCCKPLPTPSVFDLYACNKKMELYHQNILSFQDILNSDYKLSEIQKRQIGYSINSLPMYINKDELTKFLRDNFRYPLYFLDFETTQQEFPVYDGIRPYEQIPFQYSLHFITEENGELHHTEYLADENCDPRKGLAEQLVKDIPVNSCIVAYNCSFERKVITELAKQFPEQRDHLMKLTENFVDLIEPFEKGMVYDKLMGGSFSLKSVLPALFPDNPELNYSNLDDVHNGRDARNLFPELRYLNKEEREKERKNLLRYCYLDTYAMVKIWQKLNEIK